MNLRAQLNVGDSPNQLSPEEVIPLGWKEGKWYSATDNGDGSYAIIFPDADTQLDVMHSEVKAMQVKVGRKWEDCSF